MKLKKIISRLYLMGNYASHTETHICTVQVQ
jgi:hypothetical protein